MKLLVTGISHKTAPVEVREGLAFPEDKVRLGIEDLVSRPGVVEALILSTCNRVEITVAVDGERDPQEIVDRFFADTHPEKARDLEQCTYRCEDREAIHHLFRVASSLDSMVVGEPQILGQLKHAYATSKSAGALSGMLDSVLTRAFYVAKKVRSETGIGQMAVSISYAAVELARKIFGDLSGKTIMIVGAGKMSELAAKHLRRSGASRILVTNRTHERALEMASLFEGSVVEYGNFVAALPEVDILIASSGAPHYILRKPDVQKAIVVRRNRPVFLIDIAVPRNIDPAVNEIDNAFLYDIDDLQEVVNANMRERAKEARHAEELVSQEVDRMMERLKAQEIAPTIVSLQERLERIRAAEIERMRKKFGSLTPEQEEAVEMLTRGIINKVAHGPICELRRHAGKPDSLRVVEAIRKAFHLEA